MIRLFFATLLCFTFSVLKSVCQKPAICNSDCNSWTTLQEIRPGVSSLVSNDGKYIAYKTFTEAGGDRLLLQSTDGSYQRSFNVANVDIQFLLNGAKVVFISSGDSLVIVTPSESKIEYVDYVTYFKVPLGGAGKYVAYTRKGTCDTLIVEDLELEVKRKYCNVREFEFDETGTKISIIHQMGGRIVDLKSNIEKVFLEKKVIKKLIANWSVNRYCFVIEGKSQDEIFCYENKIDTNVLLKPIRIRDVILDNNSIKIQDIKFSNNGSRLFFDFSIVTPSRNERMFDSISPKAEIWNYKDKFLQADAVRESESSVIALYDFSSHKFSILAGANLKRLSYDPPNRYLLCWDVVNGDELYRSKDESRLVLIDSDSCSEVLVKRFVGNQISSPRMSPDEKFVLWFDETDKNYYSFRTDNGMVENVSKAIPFPLYDKSGDIIARRRPFGIAGWCKGDSLLLVYDEFDIWCIDMFKKRLPVNLTHLGRDKQIIFRRIPINGDSNERILEDTILMSAFNKLTKYNGFASARIGVINSLDLKSMGPCVYFSTFSSPLILIAPSRDVPQKAKNANLYVVRRMSATESPNLFVTSDFRTFRAVSNIHPEAGVNWMTSQLERWLLPDGRIGEGILFRPENFDSTKCYPLILYYYEKLSDGLYVFRKPALSNGTLDIAWYISNGYLVFIPNIYFRTGDVAKSVADCIMSAVKHLSKFSWVNHEKIGLQGHSFGAYETVSVITQTNLFAAAQESSGLVNYTNYYNHPIGSGNRNHYFDEEQGNMGCAPWDSPQVYIRNSPIFHIKNVNTPLLIMHNRGDGNSPFSQGLDLYYGLRRINRRVWMLQYDKDGEPEQGHAITDPLKQLDFTVRQQQFFNHYLKDFPAPKWMTTPGYNGFDIDSLNAIP